MEIIGLKVVAVLVSLVGFVGAFVPAIPGAPLIFAVALLYGWVTGYEEVNASLLWWLGGLAAFAQVADLLTSAVSVKIAGASRWAMWGAGAGALFGLLLCGPLGLLLGPFIGAFAGELLAGRDTKTSGKAGIAAGLGALVGMAVRGVVSVVMIALFWTRIF